MKWIESEFGDSSDWDSEKEWKPDGASEIVGKVVSKTTIDTKYGPTVLLKLESDGDIYKIWGSRSGLRKLFEQYDDELTHGREVGLRSKDKITLSSGNTFMPFEIGFGDAVVAAASSADSEEPF